MNFRASWASSVNLSSKYNKCHSHVEEIWTVNSAGLVTHNAEDAIKVRKDFNRTRTNIDFEWLQENTFKASAMQRSNGSPIFSCGVGSLRFSRGGSEGDKLWRSITRPHHSRRRQLETARAPTCWDKKRAHFLQRFCPFQEALHFAKAALTAGRWRTRSKKTDFKAQQDNTHCWRNNTEGQRPDRKTVDTNPPQNGGCPQTLTSFRGLWRHSHALAVQTEGHVMNKTRSSLAKFEIWILIRRNFDQSRLHQSIARERRPAFFIITGSTQRITLGLISRLKHRLTGLHGGCTAISSGAARGL